ncbi:MAG: tetratricopeptide repeat protein [Paramuribaculum sp.]|nr:tetratricopeptide repeat protein [Paramuribaculum sp.]
MTDNNMASLRESVVEDAVAGRFGRMFDTLDNILGAHPQWMDRSRALRTQYEALCGYALAGAPDPARPLMRAEIAAQAIGLADCALHKSEAVDSPRLYYSKYRFEKLQKESLKQMFERFYEYNSQLGMAAFAGKKDAETVAGESVRKLMEDVLTRIFNRVWSFPDLSSEDYAVIETFLTDETLSAEAREQILWALMLGGLEFYQGKRLMILGKVYSDEKDKRIRLAALTAFTLMLWNHRRIPVGIKLHGLLDLMKQRQSWNEDLSLVSMQFVRTRDTERITDKLKTEVFPAMMKLRPDLQKLGDVTGDMDLTSLEDNPEWEELLDKSGLTDKLKELSELQSDGADLMMATFSGLKSFPFFSDVANWFVPFSMDRKVVADTVTGHLRQLAEIIGASPFLCDSDKYSMIFSFNHIPESQRKMFTEQIEAQALNQAEIDAGSLELRDRKSEAVVAVLVQNLYRFFKLFRRKGEMKDPFALSPDLASLELFRETLGSPENIRLIAEFYFKRGYYNEALAHFNTLIADTPGDYQLLQKAGYCLAALGEIEKAIEMYSRSELLAPDSLWTLKRLASSYRLIGNHAKALEYYRKVESKRPDDPNVAYAIGHCLMELGSVAEARKMFYKVEYLAPESTKSHRPIAWCSFLSGDYERASQYFGRIMSDSPVASDYLNAGHLALASGKYPEAVEHYRRSIRLSSPDDFIRLLTADISVLKNAGIDNVMLEIVVDKALSSF